MPAGAPRGTGTGPYEEAEHWHLVVVRVDDTEWSDWGTPEAIARTFLGLKRTPPWRGAHAPGFLGTPGLLPGR